MSVLFLASKHSDILLNNMVNYTTTNYGDAAFTPSPWMGGNTDAATYSYWSQIELAGSTTLGETLWFHCRLRLDMGGSYSTGDGTQLQFIDTDNAVVAELYTVASKLSLRILGDTTVVSDVASRYSLSTADATYFFDISLQVSASAITMTLYVNGALSHSITVGNTTANKKKIDKLIMLWTNLFDTFTAPFAISEIIVTENEATLNWRLATLEPTAQGDFTQWIGDYTALDYKRDGTYMYAAETGIRESWDVSAYGGPTSGVNVRGVYMKYVAQAGADDGPQSVQPFVSIGGTPHDATAQALTELPAQYMAEWVNNPNTGLPWVPADFSGWEFGLRSAS